MTLLPPENRSLSPRTGWVRAHWEWFADHLLQGVLPYATPGGAFYRLPGGRASPMGQQADSLEGYARTFLLAAFRLAGANGSAPGDLADRYATGMIAGTGEPGEERWPDLAAGPNSHVEAASIAIGLYQTRPWIWDNLSDLERERIVDWFAGVRGHDYPPNNWFLFPVIIHAFLKSVGGSYQQEEIDAHLDRIDSMYRRGGWYSDGHGRNFDHYGSWAMHFYTMLWCRMDGDASDPSRAAEYRRRLRMFIEDASHLFGADGAPLFQGRSLIYRCAATAAVVAGALLDATPLQPGETRRIASGALRYVLDSGAVSNGLLAVGWHGEYRPMAQDYSGPASPYWASKGFLGLLIPPEDPFWTSVEEPLPVERSDFVRPVAAPNWLLWGTKADGIVRVANHGSDHYPFFEGEGRADANYRKLTYATHAAPDLGPAGNDADVDAHVALTGDDGWQSARSRIYPIAVADRFAASYYYPRERAEKRRQPPSMWNDRIETAVVVRGRAEIRLHGVTTPHDRRLRDGGWAIAANAPLTTQVADNWAFARRPDGLTSFIAGLRGFGEAAIRTSEGDNPFGRYSATPYLTSAENVGPESVFVSLCVLTREPLDPISALEEIESVTVNGRLVTIAWSDGETVAVQLIEVEHIDLTLSGEEFHGPIRYARVSPDGTRFVLRETS